jgi:nitroimidazol reductase NimA-like FMN-containing flavoprotein (pyridoxamine 5'-phosphate oxidase superfamily)
MARSTSLDGFTDAMRAALSFARVCRIASVGPRGPHVAPFCHVFDGERTVYVETQASRLTVRNLAHSPELVVLVDDYIENWSNIWMLSVAGNGRSLESGLEFDKAVAMLHEKFPRFKADGVRIGLVLAIDVTVVRNFQGIS